MRLGMPQDIPSVLTRGAAVYLPSGERCWRMARNCTTVQTPVQQRLYADVVVTSATKVNFEDGPYDATQGACHAVVIRIVPPHRPPEYCIKALVSVVPSRRVRRSLSTTTKNEVMV
jgi:hypothetical protein